MPALRVEDVEEPKTWQKLGRWHKLSVAICSKLGKEAANDLQMLRSLRSLRLLFQAVNDLSVVLPWQLSTETTAAV